MQLLSPSALKSIVRSEKDAQVKENYDIRQRVLKEIEKFNQQRDTLIKSKSLLEEDFNNFCTEILNKRKGLLIEIKELEDKKKSLTDFFEKSREEIRKNA